MTRTLYRSPAPFAALGLVAERAVEQDGRPDKRLYRITQAGCAELGCWQAETPPEPIVLKHTVALRLFRIRRALGQPGLLIGWASTVGALLPQQLAPRRLFGPVAGSGVADRVMV